MFCIHCGKQLSENTRFCPYCGSAVEGSRSPSAGVPPQAQQKPAKKSGGRAVVLIAGIAAVAAVLAVVFVFVFGKADSRGEKKREPFDSEKTVEAEESSKEEGSASAEKPQSAASAPVKTLVRPKLLSFSQAGEFTASCAPYQVASDFSNVTNRDLFYMDDEELALLQKNLFVVTGSYGSEFFELYESNRYNMIANFVTVDSMMHTYHLYFSLLLNKTEKNYLSDHLYELNSMMLDSSILQYEKLAGTEWENAAKRNVAYFAIAASLQDDSVQIPDYAQELVSQELERIYAAEGIVISSVSEDYMDYSQYKPRGYYEGDEVLERYFRAMMWCGQVNFAQKNEDMNRSALLMTLAMQDVLELWQQIYAVTAFFAGSSDDLGFCEYAPAIEYAYGAMPLLAELPGNGAFSDYVDAISTLDPPAINSVPVRDTVEDVQQTVKGFRFMGQRFTFDAAIMQKLVYKNVEENAENMNRMLPDVLDVPAAFGSDAALEILTEKGATEYSGYPENMEKLRQWIQDSPDELWSASLYSGWLYTLRPILEEKGEGYPSFMTGKEWAKKNLETFSGSFTELKHDTVLYAKQMMAEMGGGPIEQRDDRGYVEPEVEVYRRFAELAEKTAAGLNTMGMIDSGDMENLSRLAELARQLMTISEKELRDELLSDEEFELIRCYGGTLEHFWEEAVKDKNESAWLDSQEIPASLVTDIATDPNGRVLEVANGRPSEIYVVVNVDGTLRIASGVVYNFYQFTVPIAQRMTDTEWRREIGEWQQPDGSYKWDSTIEKPDWTDSYRYERK